MLHVTGDMKKDQNDGEKSKPVEEKASSAWLDADIDNDGDVDIHDAILVAEWLWRYVELLFDITLCVAPVGAIVGSILAVIGGVIVARSFIQLSIEVDPWVKEFSSHFNGFPEAKSFAEIALSVVIVVDALTVCHGFAVGLRRAERKVNEFGEKGGASCCKNDQSKIEPAEITSSKSSNWTLDLLCCGAFVIEWFASHLFQAIWAIGGTVVIWISIIVSYVASITSIFLFGSLYVAHAYCDDIADVIDMGVEYAESTLQKATDSIDLVEAATVTGSEASSSIYGDDGDDALDRCSGAMLGSVCSTVESRASATAALLYETSPFPELLAFLDTQLPVACSTVELGEQLVVRARDFGEFADEFKEVAAPMPGLMKQAMIGTWCMLVGQILVLVFHQKYFTLWCYEGSMAIRNARAKASSGAMAETSNVGSE